MILMLILTQRRRGAESPENNLNTLRLCVSESKKSQVFSSDRNASYFCALTVEK